MFIVVPTKRTDDVRRQIESMFDEDCYDLTPDSWLISFEGTTRALADRLGIREGSNGSGLVASIEGRSGRGPSELGSGSK